MFENSLIVVPIVGKIDLNGNFLLWSVMGSASWLTWKIEDLHYA